MAADKVTAMILNVDLKCSCCYQKLRKLLCKFPQIRDQGFDEEKNKVMITVVCCDPEKMRDKLCCKGGKAIQSIEIIDNNKPPQKPKPDPNSSTPRITTDDSPLVSLKRSPSNSDLSKNGDQQRERKHIDNPPVLIPPSVCCQNCYEGRGGGPCHYDYGRQNCEQQPERKPIDHLPVHITASVCCQNCYEGRGGGPCHYGYGRPVPLPRCPCHDGYGYGYQYAGNRPCYVTSCDCFSEENPQGCSIM